MSPNQNEGFFSNLKNDLPASLVVFLVAMPLCLGIAMASGAPLFSGIIAGFVGGIVVALISKSSLGVSGPAAGLVVIVLTAIEDLGGFEFFLGAVVVAGVFQILLGVARAGVIGYYFPSSVIKGMLSGIGLIIILKQIPHAFGYDRDPEGDFEFFQMDGHTTFTEFGYMLDAITPTAVIISVVSLLILILWERPFMKKIGLFKVIQGPLVAVLAGIGMTLLFRTIEGMELGKEHLVSLPVAESVGGFFKQFQLPNFSKWNTLDFWVVSATIAVVASLETLLCVEATDKLDPQKRVTPTNRELYAQGIGNIVSGLIGGLPITQVIVRSSANIQSGGKTRASAFFHGILLLLAVFAIPGVLNLVPLASLAAILLVVGYKLAKPSLFKEMLGKGKSQFIPFVVTILGIVFTDLLIGIGLGLAVAVIQILWNNFRTPYHFDPEDYVIGQPVRIDLSEDVSFLNKAGIMNTLNQMPEGADIIINGSRTKTIHPDIMEIFEDFKTTAQSKNISLTLTGFPDKKDGKVNPMKDVGQMLEKHGDDIGQQQ